MNNNNDAPWDDDVQVGTQSSNADKDDKPVGRRSAPVALGGKRFDPDNLPNDNAFPEYPDDEDDYVVEDDVDYIDVSSLNRQINRARSALFKATRRLKYAQRVEAEAKFNYKRAYNRTLAGLTGGSEKQRLATADLTTESLYSEVIIAERLSEEALNVLRAIRAELDALAGLSHNIRAQMQLQ